jgi:DNA-directed RNA polymerase specialized sigma24 family protein
MRAFSDNALVEAMREGVAAAWLEFDARFRPLLERYATRVGIPRWEWNTCITDVLDDEALHLVERTHQMPTHLSAYLVRAVRNRHFALKRAAARRGRRYASEAADDPRADGALPSMLSEHSLRACDPPRVSEEQVSSRGAMTTLAELVSARLTSDERQILAWVAEGVPHRVIAEWLGINREAAKKRVARLCHRLRQAAVELSKDLPAGERRAFERLVRRATPAAGTSHTGESDDG